MRRSARLRARADVWQLGDRLLLADWRRVLSGAVTAALSTHHDSQPLSDGMAREEVRERVLARAHPEAATAVLDLLAAAGTIRGRERLALEGRGVTLTTEETAAQSALASAYDAAGLTPPEADSLGDTYGPGSCDGRAGDAVADSPAGAGAEWTRSSFIATRWRV